MKYIESHSSSTEITPRPAVGFFRSKAALRLLLAIVILAALWVVMLNAVHDYARDEHKILARISLAFGLAFAVLTGAFYFVQISAVRLSLLKGEFGCGAIFYKSTCTFFDEER